MKGIWTSSWECCSGVSLYSKGLPRANHCVSPYLSAKAKVFNPSPLTVQPCFIDGSACSKRHVKGYNCLANAVGHNKATVCCATRGCSLSSLTLSKMFLYTLLLGFPSCWCLVCMKYPRFFYPSCSPKT